MGNNHVNSFVSYSSKYDYFDRYSFKNINFKIYDGVKPIINSKYPVGVYDGTIEDKDKNIIDVYIFTIFPIIPIINNVQLKEIVYMFESKQDGKLFKPICEIDLIFSKWIELIYSWTSIDDLTMKPNDDFMSNFYLTRKVYMDVEHEHEHEQKQFSNPFMMLSSLITNNKYYIEHAGSIESSEKCFCCNNKTMQKPSEEFINSVETYLMITQPEYIIDFNSQFIIIELINGDQIKTKITYDINNSITFEWNHWTNQKNNSELVYKTIYKGEFFKKYINTQEKIKYYYPDWVKDDTLWTFTTHSLSQKDMFSNIETNTHIEINDKSNKNDENSYYVNCVDNAIDLSSNQYITDLFELCEKLFFEFNDLIPCDFNKNLKIKFSNLKDLESIRNDVIEYFELLKNDNTEEGILNLLLHKLKNFNLDLIPEFNINIDNSIDEDITQLLMNKYKNPVVHSDEVIICNIVDQPNKQSWILKTIVNSQLVTHNKEIYIVNDNASETTQNNISINKNKQSKLHKSIDIVVNSKEESDILAIELLDEIAQNTWTTKSIMIFHPKFNDLKKNKQNKQNKQYKQNKQINCKIVSWDN